MNLSDFDYHLPAELIAQYPLEQRDEARMLVVRRDTGAIEHKVFRDFPQYVGPDDLLVLNDTKVLPVRLHAHRKTGGHVEVFLLRKKGGMVFEALFRPARTHSKERLYFDASPITCTRISKECVRFEGGSEAQVYAMGEVPLPPYIKRKPEEIDRTHYQTVYARNDGSVAAPTAGLHFTEGVLAKVREKGASIGYVTLHVGYATFKPVATEDILEHKMGKEMFMVPQETQRLIQETRRKPNGRIIATGTTACRALETFGQGRESGETDLFIYPGYTFKMTDALLTNFHLPKTTLFILVCTLCGMELAKKAYAEAVAQKYRFYSYGDAMLII